MTLGSWLRRKFARVSEKETSSGTQAAAVVNRRPVDAMSPAEANNDFALALFEKLRTQRGNLFFSPFSVRTALALVSAGARGDTAAEMRESLRIPDTAAEALHAELAALAERIAAAGGDSAEMAIANGLFVQAGGHVEAPFREIVDRFHHGTFHDVDFRSATEAARIAINRWVADRTRGRIDNLIPKGGVASGTLLVVANAVYFKSVWAEPFSPFATSDQPFFLDGGGKVTMPLMKRLSDRVRYARSAGFEVAEIDYRGGEMSMLVLLPERKDGLPDLEARLSAELLGECVGRLVPRLMEVCLPRFDLTWGEELQDVLRAMGLRRAFDRSRADLSGINGLAPPHPDAFSISDVLHKAFVNVGEKGTEAAAATAIEAIAASCEMPGESSVPVFRADHPFLFAIRHRASGAFLFLGRVVDPTSQG